LEQAGDEEFELDQVGGGELEWELVGGRVGVI
jgi:hypothetical protein